MDPKLRLIVDSFGSNRAKLNENLKNHTALNVGGKAGLFFIAFTTNEIIKIEEMARDLEVPFFIFGTGSKIFMDSGFEGVVVKNRTQNIHVVGVKGKVSREGMGVDEAMVEVESGVSMNKLGEFLNKQSLSSLGIEDISGTIGGNLFLSRVLQDHVKSVKVIEEGEIRNISAEKLSLRKHLILSAVFNFKAKNDTI